MREDIDGTEEAEELVVDLDELGEKLIGLGADGLRLVAVHDELSFVQRIRLEGAVAERIALRIVPVESGEVRLLKFHLVFIEHVLGIGRIHEPGLDRRGVLLEFDHRALFGLGGLDRLGELDEAILLQAIARTQLASFRVELHFEPKRRRGKRQKHIYQCVKYFCSWLFS